MITLHVVCGPREVFSYSVFPQTLPTPVLPQLWPLPDCVDNSWPWFLQQVDASSRALGFWFVSFLHTSHCGLTKGTEIHCRVLQLWRWDDKVDGTLCLLKIQWVATFCSIFQVIGLMTNKENHCPTLQLLVAEEAIMAIMVSYVQSRVTASFSCTDIAGWPWVTFWEVLDPEEKIQRDGYGISGIRQKKFCFTSCYLSFQGNL